MQKTYKLNYTGKKTKTKSFKSSCLATEHRRCSFEMPVQFTTLASKQGQVKQ